MKEALNIRLNKVKEELEVYQQLEQEAKERYENCKKNVNEIKKRIEHLEKQINKN
jgi:chromosome segregation ATPase